MAKKTTQKQDSLEKLLRYILGLRPDEFGLHPDDNGFVAVRALLAALHDEEGWRGVREGQLAMLANQPADQSLLEIEGQLVRLKPALAALPPERPGPEEMPRLLYLPLKPTAWAVISGRGLRPKPGETAARLWADQELAARIARRWSPAPVLATVRAAAARQAGAKFMPWSELLWLTTEVPAAFLSGPPVPPQEEEKPQRPVKDQKPEQAGSFHLGAPEPEVHRGKIKGKHSDAPDWKNQVRRDRRKEREG
jgi:putative RNA 2'-phosphotransferase